MRRPNSALAWGLAAAAVAVALGALVYAPESQRSAHPVATAPAELVTAPTPAPAGPAPSESDAPATAPEAVADETPSVTRAAAPGIARKRAPADEATVRARVRKQAGEDVIIGYTFLLDDLGLSREARADLVALLVEMQIEQVWHDYQRGRTIGDQERADRIAAAIGYEKLEQFLALEQSGRAYYEAYQIALLLQRRGAPTTVAQREGVFEILAKVNDWYPPAALPADVERNSLESVEHALMQYDEHDRHVIELAPGVLSPKQVVLLFEQYQKMSRERFTSLEMTKKRIAERPDLPASWMYSPGSWE
jgi:hypothetical protein